MAVSEDHRITNEQYLLYEKRKPRTCLVIGWLQKHRCIDKLTNDISLSHFTIYANMPNTLNNSVLLVGASGDIGKNVLSALFPFLKERVISQKIHWGNTKSLSDSSNQIRASENLMIIGREGREAPLGAKKGLTEGDRGRGIRIWCQK